MKKKTNKEKKPLYSLQIYCGFIATIMLQIVISEKTDNVLEPWTVIIGTIGITVLTLINMQRE